MGGIMGSFITYNQAHEKVNKQDAGVVPGQYPTGVSVGIDKLNNEIGLWYRNLLTNNHFAHKDEEEALTIGDIFAATNKAPDAVSKDPWKWPLCSDKQSNCSLMNDGGFRYIKKVLAPSRTAINLNNEQISYETLKKGVNADISDCKLFTKAFESVKSFSDIQAMVKSFFNDGVASNTTLQTWRDTVALNGCLVSKFIKIELDQEEPKCPFYALSFNSSTGLSQACSL